MVDLFKVAYLQVLAIVLMLQIRYFGYCTAAAANAAASTTIYTYEIETGPGACGTDIATGTIEVRTAKLTLTSSSTTDTKLFVIIAD